MTGQSLHRDPVTGRLLLDGRPVCGGCLKPLTAEGAYCRRECHKKVLTELRRVRQRPSTLVQSSGFAQPSEVAA